MSVPTRNPIVRKIVGTVFTVAGLAYLVYARFGKFDDSFGDKHRIFYTVGVAFLVLGPVFAFTRKRGETGGMTPQVSGIRLLAVSAVLLGTGFLFTDKSQLYMAASLWLTALVLGAIGLVRLISGLSKRR